MVLRGLYAVVDTALVPETVLVERVGLALHGGARVVQLRDKGEDPGFREWLALDLLHLCRGFNVPLLINDDVELAARIGAAGVHLGQGDIPLAEARQRLGPEAIIGISCHSSLELALQARQGGANYVAFGRFFPSHTKPIAVQADPGVLTQAKRMLDIPLVAIGGITPYNGTDLIAAGADMLAVVHGLFAAGDIRTAASQYTQLFSSNEN